MRIALIIFLVLASQPAQAGNRYDESIFFLHEDHHTFGWDPVGRDASIEKTSRLVALCRPDMIQIHAKGNPGWTTYPTKVGYPPTNLVNDVLGIWRDVARRDGYRFGIYFNLGNDGRIAANKPQWIRVDAEGNLLGRGMCFHSGVAQQYLWPMLREISVNYHPDSFWFDGTAHTVRPCYCQACRVRFEREQRLPPPKKNTDPGWADYQEMQRQIYREFIEQTIAEIHKIAPDCLVGVNNAYYLRMPEKPANGIGYLTTDIANRVDALSPVTHWFDSQRVPYDLMTAVYTADPGSIEDGVARQAMPKPAGQIQQEIAIILANGGRYSLWDVPTFASDLRPAWFEMMGRDVTPFLRARQPWCLGTRLPDVSVLHSAAAHYAATNHANMSFSGPVRNIRDTMSALTLRHLNYEMVPEWRLAEQDIDSELLIIEDPTLVTDEVANGVIEFLDRGGRVLWAGSGMNSRLREAFGVQNQANLVNESELLTVVDKDGSVTKFTQRLLPITRLKARSQIEVRTTDGNRFPLLTTCNRGRGQAFFVAVPLFTQNGKETTPPTLVDRVLATISPPSNRKVTTDAPESVEIVLRAKGDQQIVHLVNMAKGTRNSIPWTSTCLFPSNLRDRPDLAPVGKIHKQPLITDIPPAPPCHVGLRLATKPSSVHLQPQKQEISDWKYENGRVDIRVPQFAIHQMIVVQLGKDQK